MVFCIIAMIVFAFMGIFSAKYRGYAKEAFRCVFRMVTLRPCDTNFDQKMKSKITGKLMKKHPGIAKFIYKKFELISWIFILIFFVSLAYTGNAVYSLAVHGTCNPEDPASCVIASDYKLTDEGCACPDVQGCTVEGCVEECDCAKGSCDMS